MQRKGKLVLVAVRWFFCPFLMCLAVSPRGLRSFETDLKRWFLAETPHVQGLEKLSSVQRANNLFNLAFFVFQNVALG